jgi:hypothetical protein
MIELTETCQLGFVQAESGLGSLWRMEEHLNLQRRQ